MSKVVIQGDDRGTGIYTLKSPRADQNVTVELPGEGGTVATQYGIGVGKILQVKSVFDNTQYTFTAPTAGDSPNPHLYYDISGLKVSITPTLSTSKILLMGQVSVGQYTNAYNIYLRFARNSTAIAIGDGQGGHGGGATVGFRTGVAAQITTLPMTFLDSPATTSAIEYKIQVYPSGGTSYPSYINRSYNIGSYQDSLTSSLTVMEIAQ